MEITTRSLFTLIHGMGFGALYLLACSGAVVELWRRYAPELEYSISTHDELFMRIYLLGMTATAWTTVLTGAYLIYPWYRAVPLPKSINLATYPQRFLMSNPATAGWHSIGMEWKEHVAWIVPIAVTMCAAVFIQYGRNLVHHPALRNAVLGFIAISFCAAAIAGFFGAMLVRNAPVSGGATLHLYNEGER